MAHIFQDLSCSRGSTCCGQGLLRSRAFYRDPDLGIRRTKCRGDPTPFAPAVPPSSEQHSQFSARLSQDLFLGRDAMENVSLELVSARENVSLKPMSSKFEIHISLSRFFVSLWVLLMQGAVVPTPAPAMQKRSHRVQQNTRDWIHASTEAE